MRVARSVSARTGSEIQSRETMSAWQTTAAPVQSLTEAPARGRHSPELSFSIEHRECRRHQHRRFLSPSRAFAMPYQRRSASGYETPMTRELAAGTTA